MDSKLKAVITAPFDLRFIKRLQIKRIEVNYCNWIDKGRPFSTEEIIALASDADFLITEVDTINKEVLVALKKLKLVAVARSNPVNVDIEELRKRNICLITTPGRNARSVAELTLALVLMAARHIDDANAFISKNKWNAPNRLDPYLMFKAKPIKEVVVGLIGFGYVGKECAKLLKNLGFSIIFYDPFVLETKGKEVRIGKVDLKTLIASSDIISIHCVLNESTKGLIGDKEFNEMKNTAVLINTARSAIVDKQALLAALISKKIKKAYLDVYDIEPLPKEDELFSLDNVFLLPHIGGCSESVSYNQSRIIYDNLISFLDKQFSVAK